MRVEGQVTVRGECVARLVRRYVRRYARAPAVGILILNIPPLTPLTRPASQGSSVRRTAMANPPLPPDIQPAPNHPAPNHPQPPTANPQPDGANRQPDGAQSLRI